jgi:hypothetical protein
VTQVLGIAALVGVAALLAYLIRLGWQELAEIEKLKH